MTISQEHFDQVFPFYFSFEKDLRITQCGPSLHKLIDEVVGLNVDDEMFDVKRIYCVKMFFVKCFVVDFA